MLPILTYPQQKPSQVLNSSIGTSNIAFSFLEDLLIQFRQFNSSIRLSLYLLCHFIPSWNFRTISKVGEHLNIHSCMDIMDILYETEESARLYDHPHLLAAAILVCPINGKKSPYHGKESRVSCAGNFLRSNSSNSALGVSDSSMG